MENVNKQLLDAAKDVLALHDNEVFVADPWSDSMEDLRQAIATAERAQQADNQSEEAAYIKWMCETFPTVYDPPLARLWIEQKHVSFLAWMERAKQPPAQQLAEPVRIANPSPEQLYTMVTSRFESGSFPWEMVSKTGKAAWAAAAAELVFAPDTIMASHAPQPAQPPAQQLAEPVAVEWQFRYTDVLGRKGDWVGMSREEYLSMKANSEAWERYEIRELYAKPPAVAVPDGLFQTAENAAACSHNFATAKQARSPNCIAQGRCKQMLELANEITSSASPEEDELLEVAYAIARYLKLDWPSAYDVDYAFKRIDEALTGMAITVEEEQAFEHLRAMIAAAEQPK